MNAHQLTLDFLTEPIERPRATNGTEPPTVARDPRDLGDLDIDHATRFLEAELADALAAECPRPRRCECPHPAVDRDPEDGSVRCIYCGCAPPPNGGPP